MKTLCFAICISLTAAVATAQDAAPQPTKEHKFLAKSVGDRTGTMKIWVQGPDSDPIEMPFKENNKSVLNGFWVATELESGPYKGRGMTGYDPFKKKFVGTWANSMSPNMIAMEGTYDEQAHEMTMHFKDFDIASGTLVDMKSVTKDTDGVPETMTMYKKDAAGKFVRSFVMTYDPLKK